MLDRRPPHPHLPEDRRAAVRAGLLAHAREDERAPRRRRWRLPFLIPIFVVLAAGGAATAAGLFGGELDDPTSVTCYAAADLGGARELVSVSGMLTGGEQPGDRAATDLCAPYWKRGAFGDGNGVPPLIACVRDGEAVVLPGERGTCARLGLQALAARTFQSQARRRDAFQDGLAAIGLGECRSPEEVRNGVLRVVERTGLTGWKVDVQAKEKCVSTISGDYKAREVVISDDQEAVIPISDEGFTLSGSAGPIETEEITEDEYEARVRARARRACSESSGSRISSVLVCVEAKGAVGRGCASVKLAKAATEPFVVEELGRGARVVVEGEGDCLEGWEIDHPSGELRLDAAPKP